jgi:hypothetical protein
MELHYSMMQSVFSRIGIRGPLGKGVQTAAQKRSMNAIYLLPGLVPNRLIRRFKPAWIRYVGGAAPNNLAADSHALVLRLLGRTCRSQKKLSTLCSLKR